MTTLDPIQAFDWREDAAVETSAEQALADRDLRWTAGAIGAATLLLAVFNTAAMTSWVATLAPTPTTVAMRGPIDSWAVQARRLRLDQPRAAMHALWEQQRARRFAVPQPASSQP